MKCPPAPPKAEPEPYRFLRCQACGKLFTRIEWDSRRFLGSMQCCPAANVQPVLEATR